MLTAGRTIEGTSAIAKPVKFLAQDCKCKRRCHIHMHTPLVSVIVPLFNAEEYIQKAIKSVLRQSYFHFEIIVVDNGSTDRSVERLKQIDDPRLRVISWAEGGVSGARNAGIRESRGEYVSFLDADDLWDCRKLSKQVSHLLKNSRAGMIICHSQLIDEVDKDLACIIQEKTDHLQPQNILCRNSVGNGSVPLIRRSVLEKIKLKSGEYFLEELKFAENFELWMRIGCLSGQNIDVIKTPLVSYRVRPNSLASDFKLVNENFSRALEVVGGYAPELLRTYKKSALAAHYCALQTYALRNGAIRTACSMFIGAMTSDWRICLSKPGEMLQNFFFIFFGFLLPKALFQYFFKFCTRVFGKVVLIQTENIAERRYKVRFPTKLYIVGRNEISCDIKNISQHGMLIESASYFSRDADFKPFHRGDRVELVFRALEKEYQVKGMVAHVRINGTFACGVELEHSEAGYSEMSALISRLEELGFDVQNDFSILDRFVSWVLTFSKSAQRSADLYDQGENSPNQESVQPEKKDEKKCA